MHFAPPPNITFGIPLPWIPPGGGPFLESFFFPLTCSGWGGGQCLLLLPAGAQSLAEAVRRRHDLGLKMPTRVFIVPPPPVGFPSLSPPLIPCKSLRQFQDYFPSFNRRVHLKFFCSRVVPVREFLTPRLFRSRRPTHGALCPLQI